MDWDGWWSWAWSFRCNDAMVMSRSTLTAAAPAAFYGDGREPRLWILTGVVMVVIVTAVML
jgi:hypothetical protein